MEMMNDGTRQKQLLDYKQVLIKHFDRIGFLTAFIPGMEMSPGFERHTQEDKDLAFNMSVKFFNCLIPFSLYDEKYKKQIEQIEKTKNSEYWFDMLTAQVNLLDRKGLLFEKKGIAQLIKFDKEKSEGDSEEWEE